MASGVVDEEYDFGGDDAFDELPGDTLHQLEEDAFLSTQAPKQGLSVIRLLDNQHGTASSSDYDPGIYDDEDVIDLNAEPIALPLPREDRDLNRNHHDKPTKPPNRLDANLNRPSYGAAGRNGARDADKPRPQATGSFRSEHQEVDIQALVAQVEHLRQQNEELQQASRDNQAIAQTKTGEAALLRRKIESTSSEYEKRIQRERDTHTQAFQTQKAALEAALRDKKTVEANNLFLEHEARQVHASAVPKRSVTKAQDVSTSRSNSLHPLAQPRKTDRTLPFRDGFDDEDIMVVSPSKIRQKPETPKKAGKRKRSAEPSPAKAGALAFAEPAGSPAISFIREDSERTAAAAAGAASADDSRTQQRSGQGQYKLLQRLLNYCPRPYTGNRFIEAMGEFAFPTQPDIKLSSFIMDYLQILPDSSTLETHILSALARAWKRCLDEAYYTPVNILMATIHYILRLQRLAAAAGARHEIVPLVTRTVDLVAIPTGLAGKNGTELSPDIARIDKQVDIQECLDLLRCICTACARTRGVPIDSKYAQQAQALGQQDLQHANVSPIESFWQILQFDFILVLLMRSQPKQAMRTILSMLPSSCLAQSFGTIVIGQDSTVNQEKQSKCEGNTLHRLLDLLFEVPKPLKGREKEAWDEADLAHLRLDILSIFKSMCLVQPISRSKQSHGSKLLAQHPRAVGKLFRFLSDSTTLLYTYPPPPLRHFVTGQVSDEPTPHALTAEAINTTMRILHHLIKTFDKDLDVRQKLAAVPGGHHRHLVSLSRLAFSDQIFLDAGIEDSTVDAAHDMLDNHLTYEEGESLVTLFSTPTSKATNASGGFEQRASADADLEAEAEMDKRAAGTAADVIMEAPDTDDDGAEEL